LGGNRRHHIRNLVIVWFLTGLWHGASWNFVIWGLFYGFIIILEKTLLSKVLKKIPAFVSHIYLLLIVNVAWVFFYFTDINKAIGYIGVMFGMGANGFCSVQDSMTLLNNGVFLIIAAIGCTPVIPALNNLLRTKTDNWKHRELVLDICRPAINVVLILLCTAFLVGRTYNPFLYFRF
jgi:alginate O-acetyltransferase complex protein AlgI